MQCEVWSVECEVFNFEVKCEVWIVPGSFLCKLCSTK